MRRQTLLLASWGLAAVLTLHAVDAQGSARLRSPRRPELPSRLALARQAAAHDADVARPRTRWPAGSPDWARMNAGGSLARSEAVPEAAGGSLAGTGGTEAPLGDAIARLAHLAAGSVAAIQDLGRFEIPVGEASRVDLQIEASVGPGVAIVGRYVFF
jgi:hypothetical protein